MRKIGSAAWLCLGFFTATVQAEHWYLGGHLGLSQLDDADNTSPAAGLNPGFTLFPGVGPAESTEPRVRYGSEHRRGTAFGLNLGFAMAGGWRPEWGLDYRSNDYDSITISEGLGVARNGSRFTAQGDTGDSNYIGQFRHSTGQIGALKLVTPVI